MEDKIKRNFLQILLYDTPHGRYHLFVPMKEVLRGVEKRKISYFGLAHYLIQHWISPNQDDLSYSARTFISG